MRKTVRPWASIIEAIRAEAGNSMLIDNGDIIEIPEIRDHEIDFAHDIAPSRSFGFASVSARNLAMRSTVCSAIRR